jgi:hypothetical protein
VTEEELGDEKCQLGQTRNRVEGLAKIGCRPYYFGWFWKFWNRRARETWMLFLIFSYKLQGWDRHSSGRTKQLPDHGVSGRDRRAKDLRVVAISSTESTVLIEV